MTSRPDSLLSLVAIAIAMTLGFPAPSNAIYLAPNEAGEVLIFPYYTVRNGFDTLISVTNISDRTVLATLRVREARNGRPLREFHLALTAYDVWTGAVTSDGGDGAVVRSFDYSCTAPALEAGPNGSTQVALSAAGFDGTDPRYPYDNGGRDLSRVQEGFVEVIQMAISNYPIPGHWPDSDTDSSIQYRTSIGYRTAIGGVHVPRDCPGYQALMAYPANFDPVSGVADTKLTTFSSFEAPKNVLLGSATLINVGSGHAYDATPTTIQNFRSGTPILYMPGSGKPTLAHGDTGMTASQFDRDGNIVTTPNIASSVDAVSVVLMADSLINEFARGTAGTSSAKTDWVVTFPTKHFYTDAGTNGSSSPLPPFSQAYVPTGQSCDRVDLTHADRDGRFGTVPESVPQFATPPSGPFFYHHCASVNRFSFSDSSGSAGSVLGSLFAQTLPVLYSSGWLSASFPLTGPTTSGGTDSKVLRGTLLGFTGLPAIGFAVIERNNSAEAGNNRNYGSGRPHVVDLIAR